MTPQSTGNFIFVGAAYYAGVARIVCCDLLKGKIQFAEVLELAAQKVAVR